VQSAKRAAHREEERNVPVVSFFIIILKCNKIFKIKLKDK